MPILTAIGKLIHISYSSFFLSAISNYLTGDEGTEFVIRMYDWTKLCKIAFKIETGNELIESKILGTWKILENFQDL